MELSDLTIFRAVVANGGVTRAAEKLNRVQSNVTTRVRQLEDELGVELFIREGKKLILSPAGKVLLDYADRMLALAQQARDAMHETTPRGTLRLGSIESTAAVRLPGPLNAYHGRHPDVTLELRTGSIRELTAAVLSGELDAAMVVEPVTEPGLDKALIFDEELVIVSSARQGPIRSATDVGSQALLAFEAGCPYRLRLEQWFALSGALPKQVIEMTSWHAILGCAAAGMGVALLPRMVLTTFPQQSYISVHPLPRTLSHAPTMLVWRKGAQSAKVTALREVLHEHRETAQRTTTRGIGRKRAARAA